MASEKLESPEGERQGGEIAALPFYEEKTSAGKPAQGSSLMGIEGVEGVGSGKEADGRSTVVVYVRDAEAAKRIPRTVDGSAVQVEITGPIQAQKP